MLNLNFKEHIFPGPLGEQKAIRVSRFIKAMAKREADVEWCIEHNVPLTRATNESGNLSGGFLAPQDFDSNVINVAEVAGAARQGIEIRRTLSGNQVRPRRIGLATANLVSEGATIPESKLQFDAVEATPRKGAVLLRGSMELLEDSDVDLATYLVSETGVAFAYLEDDITFNADGTSAYQGMVGLTTKLAGMKSAVSAASGHNTFQLIDSVDLTNLMAGVLALAIPGSCFYMGPIAYAQIICRLAATTGGLVSRMKPDGTIIASYLGFPIRFSAKLPNVDTGLTGKPVMFFGNLAQSSVLVQRQDQTVVSLSLERGLDADQFLLRGVRRQHIITHSVGDTSNCGPMAVLLGG